MGENLGVSNFQTVVDRQPTKEKLQELHDRWVGELHKEKKGEINNVPFPLPPIPGSEEIIPITTYRELFVEGKKMHHCVACYLQKIRSGNSYIYKVFAPQRATLEIVLNQGSSPGVGQLKLAHNQEPSKETLAAVHEWMRVSRLS